MQKDQDFYIRFKGRDIKVTPLNDEGNIHFVVHLDKPTIIAERMLGDSWFWVEMEMGETELAREIGEIIEAGDA